MHPSAGTRVRARQKPMEELPAWALCCEPVREIMRQQQEYEAVAIFPTLTAVRVECRYCHAASSNILCVLTEPLEKHGMIPVDCFEFDEGVAA